MGSSIVAFSAMSHAQAQNLEGENAVDEIVVTATRTAKPLLESPAAVTVQNMDNLNRKAFFTAPISFGACLGYSCVVVKETGMSFHSSLFAELPVTTGTILFWR